MRARFRRAAAVVLALVLSMGTVAACSQQGGPRASSTLEPDLSAAATQAEKFETYAMADDWVDFAQFFDSLCEKYDLGCQGTGAGPNRFDTDFTAAEQISAFDSLRDAAPVCGDIGMAFADAAAQAEVTLPYTPAGAESLPASLKEAGGGWVATYVGAISFWVNDSFVEEPPQTWSDLLNPAYRGQISMSDPRQSGTGAATLYAAAAALGDGDLDFDAAFQFFRELRDSGNLSETPFSAELFERGELPIVLRYDFVAKLGAANLEAKGLETSIHVPEDGGIWAPSAIICNRYTNKPDLAMLIMDFALSDEGQLIFAKYGARPVRSLNGDLVVPEEYRKNWLPDSMYENVISIERWEDPTMLAAGWNDVVLSGDAGR